MSVRVVPDVIAKLARMSQDFGLSINQCVEALVLVGGRPTSPRRKA